MNLSASLITEITKATSSTSLEDLLYVDILNRALNKSQFLNYIELPVEVKDRLVSNGFTVQYVEQGVSHITW